MGRDGVVNRNIPFLNRFMKRLKDFLLLLLCSASLFPSCSKGDGVSIVTPEKFSKRLHSDSKASLLDVRRPDEFAEGHLAGAVNINWLDTPAFRSAVNGLDKGPTYYIYCRSGRRSHAAALHMKGLGFKVVDMAEGYLGWVKRGLPVEKDAR